VLAALVAAAVPAAAHLTVSSPDAEPGGFGKLVVRVPTELASRTQTGAAGQNDAGTAGGKASNPVAATATGFSDDTARWLAGAALVVAAVGLVLAGMSALGVVGRRRPPA
jgi:hypothetical protein